jgi:hypothetical protein
MHLYFDDPHFLKSLCIVFREEECYSIIFKKKIITQQ